MKLTFSTEQLAPVFRLMSTASTQPPDRAGYIRLLRRLDRLFLRALGKYGASTWVELREVTTLRGEPDYPARATVEDWMTIALRRGLIERFGEGKDSVQQRWGVTADGASISQGWTRYVWPATRTIGGVLFSLASLVLGSAVLLGSLGHVDWDSVSGSLVFEISVAVLLYAAGLPILWAATWRYRAMLAIGAIDLTRVHGDLPGLEIEPERVAAYSAPPQPDRALS